MNTVPRAGRRGPTRSPLKAPSRYKPCAAIAWSGGKDSCHALARADTDYNVIAMITMFDDDGRRSRSHGLRPEMIAAQAKRLQLETLIGRCAWDADSVELAIAELEERDVDPCGENGEYHTLVIDSLSSPHHWTL